MKDAAQHHAYFHELLPQWLGLSHTGDNAIERELRTAMTRRGLQARTCRLYLEFGDDLFAPLAGHASRRSSLRLRAERALTYLAVLQECDAEFPPPPRLIRSLAAVRSLPLNPAQAPLLKAAWKEYMRLEYSDGATSEWLVEEAAPLLRWAMEEGDPARLKSRRKLSWAVLRRRWVEALQNRALPHWSPAWPMPWGYFSLAPGWLWVPLESAEALTEEGLIMRHCAGDYADQCAEGDYRIYSLRSLPDRERVATLGLIRTPAGWVVAQFKRPGNEEFSDDADEWNAVRVLLERIQQRRRWLNDLIDDQRWREEAKTRGALGESDR